MIEDMDVWDLGLGSRYWPTSDQYRNPARTRPKAQDLRCRTLLTNDLFIKVDVLWNHNIGPISCYG